MNGIQKSAACLSGGIVRRQDSGRGYCRGFTLVEMMVVIIVMLILAAWALPNFRDMYIRAQVTAHANELITSLQLARSEALKRGATVTLEPDGASLAEGWIIKAESFKGGDAINVQKHGFLKGVTITLSNTDNALAFNARGGMIPSNDIWLMPNECPAPGARVGRLISISVLGRISSSLEQC